MTHICIESNLDIFHFEICHFIVIPLTVIIKAYNILLVHSVIRKVQYINFQDLL